MVSVDVSDVATVDIYNREVIRGTLANTAFQLNKTKLLTSITISLLHSSSKKREESAVHRFSRLGNVVNIHPWW